MNKTDGGTQGVIIIVLSIALAISIFYAHNEHKKQETVKSPEVKSPACPEVKCPEVKQVKCQKVICPKCPAQKNCPEPKRCDLPHPCKKLECTEKEIIIDGACVLLNKDWQKLKKYSEDNQ